MLNNNKRGFTLIEMLITITVLAIVMPLMFSVINSSFKELGKMESLQLRNVSESRLINRLDEDFRTLSKLKFLSSDSIAFFTTRDRSFQQKIVISIENNNILYQVNDLDKKILLNNINPLETQFYFLNYDNSPKPPGDGQSYTVPEINTMPRIKLNYEFAYQNETVNNSFVITRRLPE